MNALLPTPPLGLVSISFRPHTAEEIAAATAAAGLSCVEWGSDVHAPCTDDAALRRIVALQETYGLTCCSYGTYFWLGKTPLAELTDYIKAAKTLGTDLLRLWCGVKGSADYTAEERDALFALCREAAAVAAAHGVTLGLECHIGTFTDEADAALALMQAVDSPHLQMYWQPHQNKTAEENLRYARLLAPYIRRVHVFNWAGEDRFPLGEAVALWRQYRSCLDPAVPLLLEFMPDDRLATLPTEAKALKEIVL